MKEIAGKGVDTWSPSTRDQQEKIIVLLKQQSEINLSILAALNKLKGIATGMMVGGRITLDIGSNYVSPVNHIRKGLMIQNLGTDIVYISMGTNKGAEGIAIEYLLLYENPIFLDVTGAVFVYAASVADICFYEVW